MKTAEDFRRSIGPAAPEFEQTVYDTLNRLQKKEEKPLKKKTGFIIAIALLLVITGTAFAADWNVLELLDLWRPAPAPAPTENPTLQFDSEGDAETEGAVFRIHQAYHSGSSLYVVAEAAPKDEDTMLFMVDYSGKYRDIYLEKELYSQQQGFLKENYQKLPMNIMGPDFADCQMTVEEYLVENGKKALYFGYLDLIVDTPEDADQTGVPAFDQITRADGSALLLCRLPCGTKEKEIACHFNGYISQEPGYYAADQPNTQFAALRFTVPANQAQKAALFEGPITVKEEIAHWDGPISADWVKASSGPFGTDVYVSWRFKVPLSSAAGVGLPAFCTISLGEGLDAPFDPRECLVSEWSPKNPLCFGLQHAYFPDVTELPHLVYLTCDGTTMAVELIPE